MDLSKIPEPSEEEIEKFSIVMLDGGSPEIHLNWLKTQERDSFWEQVALKVGWHSICMGRVLAKNIDIEMVNSDQLKRVLAAIEFFEQFGGSDER